MISLDQNLPILHNRLPVEAGSFVIGYITCNRLLLRTDVLRSALGNLFMKRCLSLGMRPPTQIP
jgi:hypothetical protein